MSRSEPQLTDEWVTAATLAMDITIDPAWAPSVRGHLTLMLRLAGTMLERPLPDEAEPAPVYRA